MMQFVAAVLTILRFTTPAHDAYPGVTPDGEVSQGGVCDESPNPVGALAEARLYRLGVRTPEQGHVAGLPGAPDSFAVDVPEGELRTYYVTVRKPSGAESCPSNLVTLNGRLDAPLSTPAAPIVRYYDVQGRRVHEPLVPGIYWRVSRGVARRVVRLR
jgi:hypothetical protein